MSALLILLPSCATVTRGTNEDFTVETTPSGAIVELSNGLSCTSTPCTMKVPRKGDFVATVSKEGYETVEATVEAKLSGNGTTGFLGNALIGGVIGAGVDASSGAMLDHQPNPLIITLEPLDGTELDVEPMAESADEPVVDDDIEDDTEDAEPAS